MSTLRQRVQELRHGVDAMLVQDSTLLGRADLIEMKDLIKMQGLMLLTIAVHAICQRKT